MNFLALLGWSPGDDEEVFTRDELVARFSLDGISGGNAVFNPEKLDWFNQQHLMRLPAHEILRASAPGSDAAGLWPAASVPPTAPASNARIDLVKPRARKLADLVAAAAAVHRRATSNAIRPPSRSICRAGSGGAPRGVARRLAQRRAVRRGDARGSAARAGRRARHQGRRC